MMETVIRHYDLLIAEENDPVRDPKPLRDYMDQWDGQGFLDRMQLNPDKTVLEIGVGTGRLAVRVAPLCGSFWGIDISPKTVERARENLAGQGNVTLVCGDFLDWEFDSTFDVVYSSLTFLHIADKSGAVRKTAALLNPGGRFVLSIDKDQSGCIDMETRTVKTYPDVPEEMAAHLHGAGLQILEQCETPFAVIFLAEKKNGLS